jgi:cold shock CspA family protein
MPQGQITKWVSGADEGTILGDDGQNVGLRRDELADPSSADNLAEGQRVEYEIKDSGSGPVGWNVRLLT